MVDVRDIVLIVITSGLPKLQITRVMSVKSTECSELCGVMYVKPSVVHVKGDKGLAYTQCMLAKW